MSVRYPTREDGEWFPLPRLSKLSCCDCKLTHYLQVRVNKKWGKPQVEMRAWRDARATAARRRRGRWLSDLFKRKVS